ncbi:hypothetical protein ACFL1H_00215 [Nanoarchaeota archaeon]
MKKGQGLTLNTIVIAALVIIVLVVLTIIVGSSLGLFGREVQQDSKAKACSYSVNNVVKYPQLNDCLKSQGNEVACIKKLEECNSLDLKVVLKNLYGNDEDNPTGFNNIPTGLVCCTK